MTRIVETKECFKLHYSNWRSCYGQIDSELDFTVYGDTLEELEKEALMMGHASFDLGYNVAKCQGFYLYKIEAVFGIGESVALFSEQKIENQELKDRILIKFKEFANEGYKKREQKTQEEYDIEQRRKLAELKKRYPND